MKRPEVVCLCGSTRFWDAFRDEGLRLTLEGKIVLSIGIAAPDSMTFAHASDEDGKRTKAALDDLHLRKIDLADVVRILNRNGYIGYSTTRELAYATIKKKVITWLEPASSEECFAQAAAFVERNHQEVANWMNDD